MKLINVVRLILISCILYNLNVLFVLTPYRNSELNAVFTENLSIIETACDKTKYRYPTPFIIITFSNLLEEIAYCQRKANGFVIVFDKVYWDKILTKSDRKQVMMHEMVHCMFNQKHLPDSKHFMAEFFEPISEEEFKKQTDEYLKNKCS